MDFITYENELNDVTKSKAIKYLRALVSQKLLKIVCQEFDISYKFCQGVSTGAKMPTFALMKKLRPIIPIEYWFEYADDNFVINLDMNMDDEENSKEAFSKNAVPNLTLS